jgi:hypothetical protein
LATPSISSTSFLRQLLDLDAPDELQLALSLSRLGGLGSKTLDEGLLLGDLLLAFRDLLFAAFAIFALGSSEVPVVAGVDHDGLVVEVDDVRRDVVQKPVVVGDDQRAPLEVFQELLEPTDRQDVEVVGGLVEQQHVRLRREHLGQQDPQLEAAGKRRKRLAVALRGDPQALEDLAGAGLQAVAVLSQDDVFQPRVAVAVEVPIGMGQEPLLLDHRLPELGVSHHHDVEDALALVLEVVLLEHPERGALRYRDLALAGLLPSAQDLEQGGFA